jgi:polyphosphate glucokinase
MGVNMQALGIDVGGSGIKGALVDLRTGEFTCKRVRLKTPASFEIDAVTKTIARLIKRFDHDGPVGVGFPAAVANGRVLTAPTAHSVPGWVGQSVNERISQQTGREVKVLNDADAAGLAEVRFGAGRGVHGVVITVTLGTGVGGGLFMDGKLVPNLEVGKLYLANHAEAVEQYMAGRIRSEQGLSWEDYGQRVHEFCRHVELIFSPELLIIGGGISIKHKKFLKGYQYNYTRVVPAKLRNQAGITGAAIWAAGI